MPDSETPDHLTGDEADLVAKHTKDGSHIPDGVTPVKDVPQHADPIEGSPA